MYSKAEDKEKIAVLNDHAKDTAIALVNDVLLAAKDGKITEEEFQVIADIVD